mmetsp:Transcript_21188/g.38915  ORF Transcript_21188/g.38915 Transcript_21188/m.38915 type:complete len:399 (+) Transcript_21188:14-1210(+)
MSNRQASLVSSTASRLGIVIALLLPALLFWSQRVQNCIRTSSSRNANHNNTQQLQLEYDVHFDDDDDTSLLDLEGVIPRAFPVFTDPFPCVEPEKDWAKTSVLRSPASEGFFFMKEMKTGSSTVAGVALRISLNMARRLGRQYEICRARFDHTRAWQMEFGKRNRKKSFLWTIIREPNSRAASQFFHFEVSRKKVEPTDANFMNYLHYSIDFDNHYFQTLSTTDYMGVEDEVEFSNKILLDYDFIGITERMDESLVVLSMLLNLELTDILYLKSKENGSFDDGGLKECTYIVPTYVSPGMKTYFSQNNTWTKRTRGDALLHRAARRSLDMTIDQLGRKNFTTKFTEFKRLRKEVEEQCQGMVVFPCDAGGNRHKLNGCLWVDSGCGNSCIDHMVHQMT